MVKVLEESSFANPYEGEPCMPVGVAPPIIWSETQVRYVVTGLKIPREGVEIGQIHVEAKIKD